MKQGFRWGFLKMMVNINSHIVLLQPFSFLSVYFFGHMLSPSFWWDDEVGKGDTAGVWVVADPYQCKKNDGKGPVHSFHSSSSSSSFIHPQVYTWWWRKRKLAVQDGGGSGVCVGGYHMVHTAMCSARYRSSFYICLTCLFDAPFSISAPTTTTSPPVVNLG